MSAEEDTIIEQLTTRLHSAIKGLKARDTTIKARDTTIKARDTTISRLKQWGKGLAAGFIIATGTAAGLAYTNLKQPVETMVYGEARLSGSIEMIVTAIHGNTEEITELGREIAVYHQLVGAVGKEKADTVFSTAKKVKLKDVTKFTDKKPGYFCDVIVDEKTVAEIEKTCHEVRLVVGQRLDAPNIIFKRKEGKKLRLTELLEKGSWTTYAGVIYKGESEQEILLWKKDDKYYSVACKKKGGSYAVIEEIVLKSGDTFMFFPEKDEKQKAFLDTYGIDECKPKTRVRKTKEDKKAAKKEKKRKEKDKAAKTAEEIERPKPVYKLSQMLTQENQGRVYTQAYCTVIVKGGLELEAGKCYKRKGNSVYSGPENETTAANEKGMELDQYLQIVTQGITKQEALRIQGSKQCKDGRVYLAKKVKLNQKGTYKVGFMDRKDMLNLNGIDPKECDLEPPKQNEVQTPAKKLEDLYRDTGK